MDLTDNKLNDVPTSAMTAIPQLRELQLSQNPIQKIKSFAFSYLNELIKLGQYQSWLTHIMHVLYIREAWKYLKTDFQVVSWYRTKLVWNWNCWISGVLWTQEFKMAETRSKSYKDIVSQYFASTSKQVKIIRYCSMIWKF